MKDMRIKQPAVNVQFCLKLPQSIYDSETGVVETVFTPRKRNLILSKLFAEFDEELDSANERNDNKRSGSTFTLPPLRGTTMMSTPSMSMIVGLKQSGS